MDKSAAWHKAGLILLIISVLINIVIISIYLKPKEPYNIYKEKIDSLESQISHLKEDRDSIQLKIDTVYKEISNVNTEYEKNIVDILHFTISEDYLFFTSYLDGFSYSDNSSSAEEN